MLRTETLVVASISTPNWPDQLFDDAGSSSRAFGIVGFVSSKRTERQLFGSVAPLHGCCGYVALQNVSAVRNVD
jgi:hypothetical protein